MRHPSRKTRKNLILDDSYRIALIDEKDTAELFHLINTNAKRLHQYFPITVQQNQSKAATEQYVRERLQLVESKEGFTFKIIDVTHTRIIGLLIIKKIKYDIGECELAYFIDEAYQGKGITSQGIKTLITYCKETLQLKKAIIRVGRDNPGSLRIAEKHTFVCTKVIPNGHKDYHGNHWDILHYERIL